MQGGAIIRILDSHEFIEMYRGDKDLRIGKILCEKHGCEYVIALPGVSSPADQKLLGSKTPNIERMKPFPDGFRVVPMKSSLLYVRKTNISLGGFFQLSPGYLGLIKRVNPDLLFECIYTTMTPRMYTTAMASKLMQIPRVYLDVGDIPRKGRMKRYAKKAEPVMLGGAERIITYNELGRQRIMEEYRIPGDRVIVVPKPVDTTKFSPEIDGIEIRKKYGLEDSFVVAYFGRLDFNKGSDVLVEVAKQVKDDPRFEKVKFLFVGGHLSRIDAGVVEKRIMDSDLKSVILTGYVDHSLMPQFQAAADAVVYPDVTNLPGFSQVLAESMSSGKAIVIGNREFEKGTPIRDKESGLVTNPRSKKEIIDSLEYLKDNESERVKFGRAVRGFAAEHMDWEKVAGRYHSIFEDVLR